MAEDTGQTTNEESTSLQWHCLDFGWLVFTWPGRFKSLEFLTTLLGVILVSSLNVFDKEPRYGFYVFVGVFTWVMVLVHMLLGIAHFIEKLPAVITQPFVFLVLCGIAVLVWLIAACLLVTKNRNDVTIKAGTAFGFMSMFLFVFEAIYYLIRWRRSASKNTGIKNTNKEVKEPAGNDYVAQEPAY